MKPRHTWQRGTPRGGALQQGFCDCGNVATKRWGHDWECDKCRELRRWAAQNISWIHPADVAERVTAESDRHTRRKSIVLYGREAGWS